MSHELTRDRRRRQLLENYREIVGNQRELGSNRGIRTFGEDSILRARSAGVCYEAARNGAHSGRLAGRLDDQKQRLQQARHAIARNGVTNHDRLSMKYPAGTDKA